MQIPTRRRIVLSGTPIQNDLQEFYSIVEFCNPGILGTSTAFKRVYETPILQSRLPNCTPDERRLGEARAAELQRITSLFCLRRTAEVNHKYLPPKVDIVLFCRPSALQLALYNAMLHSSVLRSCYEPGAHYHQHLQCISGLKKICIAPVLLHSSPAVRCMRPAQ